MSPKPARLTLVYATWCPHCVPVSTDRAPLLARRWKVPLRLLDIDRPDEEAIADELVRDHGDWTEDYLIPQVLLEWEDGRVTHLLTGVPGDVSGTVSLWDRLLMRGEPPIADGVP
ncbi:MAG: hypothetical protein L3J95_04305 [Thermoplasmata archaeon]|nr:hypothetical protein [Thermoplasmata archaeon]MCI4359629.1 hypothetical protein [Thermoplasmata archaeon]